MFRPAALRGVTGILQSLLVSYGSRLAHNSDHNINKQSLFLIHMTFSPRLILIHIST
jgi:hypothetical protein